MCTRLRRKSVIRRIGRLALWGIAAWGLSGCSSESVESANPIGTPAASFLAVGDTGEPWGALPWLFEGQLAVGAAMQREHAAAPVDAVMLLGDNFYPNGLLRDELIPRILENVVRPYCAFIEPSEKLRREMGDDCPLLAQVPPPIYAVVGNHDHRSSSSVSLQKEEVPHFVLNWSVPEQGAATLREIAGGMSLIFLDSESPWNDAKADALASALESAAGPFRIVVGHRPPIAGHPGLSEMVERASKKSQRRVHAYLAGHVHGLGAIPGEGDAPVLTVIAGSGARADLQESTEYEVTGADPLIEALGFARFDSFPSGEEARLEVTLFQAGRSPVLAFLGHAVAARYVILPDGTVERIDESGP
jgi:hypothetical protein